MPAYLIADTEITDAERYEEYRALVAPIIASFGGRFVVRGGEFEVLEGDWHPRRLVVIEFPSLKQARRWYTSPEYGEIKHLRLESSSTNSVLVRGT